MDTSATVKLGQRDMGAYCGLVKITAELLTELGGDELPYDAVMLRSSANEYRRFFEQNVLDNNKVPKGSMHVVNAFPDMEFPKELRDRLEDAKNLWYSTSRRVGTWDKRFGRLHIIEKADTELLAYALEQADNGRICIVFTYDEDLIGPVSNMASKNDRVKYVADAAFPLHPFVHSGEMPLLIPSKVLGELYALQSCETPSQYLLTAKAPFLGERVDVAVSLHQIEGRITFEEGDASRHVLVTNDVDELFSVKGYRQRAIKDRLIRSGRKQVQKITADYAPGRFSVVSFGKSRKYGFMELKILKNHTYFGEAGLTREAEPADIRWFSFDGHYLGRFSLETEKYLEDFRKRYPK